MVGTQGSTRAKMINSAISLLATRGAAGTTVDGVLAASGAPRGSVYHHFPGGRDELIAVAARTAGERMAVLLQEGEGPASPRQALAQLADFWRTLLVVSDFRSGCAIAALTVAGGEQIPSAPQIAREVFAGWQDQFRGLLIANGYSALRAASLATLVVASLEGAVILARAERSTAALDAVVGELAELLPDSH